MDDAAYLDAVRDNPRATTQEVAEILGVSERAADHRLRKLFADGKLDSKTIGNSLIWLPLTETVEDSTDADDEPRASPED